jgi:hypothetical protein
MRLLLKRKEGMAPGREEMYDIDDIVVRLAESNLLFDEAKLGGGPWEVWLRVGFHAQMYKLLYNMILSYIYDIYTGM